MGKSLSFKTFFVIFLGFFILPGCAALDLPDTALGLSGTEEIRTSQHSISDAKNGLTVTVDLIRDEERLKRHFGADLSKKGILPVYIKVVNDSDSAYLFLNQKIKQGNAPVDERRNAGGDYEAALILTGPLFAAFKDAEGSKERAIRHNVLAKRLKMNMLSPGEQRSGFLYFKVSRIEDTAKILTLNFLSLTTKRTNEFAFIAINKK
jgi:hypothetical protein